MDFKDLLQFIEIEDGRIKKYYGNYADQEMRILVRTVKLTEELGELCNEVLSRKSFQRKEKLNDHQDNLPEEFADVIITAMLLAKALEIDIEKTIEKKIKKINRRYE